MTNPAKAKLHQDLIDSIDAEDRFFNMAYWVTPHIEDPFAYDPNEPVATCDTASCIAGHLEAIRPELAAELAPSFRNRFGLNHERLAVAIYERETGEACRLDFRARNHTEKNLHEVTREDAIAHVRGEHPNWPLLSGRHPDDGDDLDFYAER